MGLAQVALRQGMTEDAVNFATGALERDPAWEAQAVLSALSAPIAVWAVSWTTGR